MRSLVFELPPGVYRSPPIKGQQEKKMKPSPLIPAAEYVRMSTDQQDYSIPHQQYAIANYAAVQHLKVVKSYADAGKSGLDLRHRPGLQSLLRDVASGNPGFNVILVYDVSRWGRFQDIDEAAHYEFLCRSAGIPVHYCVECFENDGNPASVFLKTMKRTMAAEYSSALSKRVILAQRRLVELGFSMGQKTVYGFRRVLVSREGVFRQVLSKGDRKSVTSDRVVLIKGPFDELKVIQRIFRLALNHGSQTIAERLNRDCVPAKENRQWTKELVGHLLRNPIYAGYYVWGRTAFHLKSYRVPVPRSNWIVKRLPGPPIVCEILFQKVQKAISRRKERKSDKELLDEFRTLLASEGKLNTRNVTANVKHCRTAMGRFGGLMKIYKKLGYHPPPGNEKAAINNIRMRSLRATVMQTLLDRFPTRLAGFRLPGHSRVILRLDGAIPISVIVGRSRNTERGAQRWRIAAVPQERSYVTLVAFPTGDNSGIEDYYLFPGLGMRFSIDVSRADEWLKFGVHLRNLGNFCDAVISLQNARILNASNEESAFEGARLGSASRNLVDLVAMSKRQPLVGWKEIAKHLKLTLGQAYYLAVKGLPRFREGGSICAWPKGIDAWTGAHPVRCSRPSTCAVPEPLRRRSLRW